MIEKARNKKNIRRKNVISPSTIEISIERDENRPEPPKKKISRNISLDSSHDKKLWIVRHKVLAFFLLILFIVAVVGAFLGARIYLTIRSTQSDINLGDLVNIGKSVVQQPDTNSLELLEKTSGRTNLLLVGIDSRGDYKSLLTDSIMLMSYDHGRKDIAQISLPRDLLVKYKIKNIQYSDKINSVLTNFINSDENESSKIKTGFEGLGAVVSDITGLQVHYGMMINFQAFQNVIDVIGGVNINVENSFCDKGFPNSRDSGTVRVEFSQGNEKMNGERALQYARSRVKDPCDAKSLGTPVFEGNDYARAKRQQKVIAAVKDEITGSSIVDQTKITLLFTNNLGSNIKLYKLNGDEITNLFKARDGLKQTVFYSMVLGPLFGSYANQLIYDGGESKNYANLPTKNYNEVKNAVQFYLDNSSYLIEDPKVKIIYSSSKRSADYLNAKSIMQSNYLKFEYNDLLTSVKPVTATPTPVITGLAIKPPTNFASIYIINETKKNSVELLKSVFAKNNKILLQKEKVSLPQELSTLTGFDIIIVVE